MLKIIRRVFSFGDWSRTHPSEPHPGDMLDAQFDEIIDRIDGWDDRVRKAILDDGTIAYGAITNQSVVPQISDAVYSDVTTRTRAQIDAVDRAAKLAAEARDRAEAALIQAQSLQAQAQVLGDQLLPQQLAALQQIAEQVRLASDLIAEARSLQDDWTNAQKDAFAADQNAMLWAEVSHNWAEFMPGPLPPNTLEWMGITGDHWSARWWANYADNAFGRMSDMYLGALHDPPLTDLNGGPLNTGSIYYDLDDGQMYVWDGAGWAPLWAPQKTAVGMLHYQATAGQQTFALTNADLNGNTYTINATTPEQIDVHVNGVKLVRTGASGTGDYTLAAATSTITLARALRAEDIVSVDVLLPPGAVANGTVESWSLNAITTFNGSLKTFTLTPKNPAVAVNIVRSEELLFYLNDVPQEPGVDFTALGDQITFAVAPAASTPNFSVWHQGSGVTAGGGTVAWGDISGKPATFTPSAHTHAQSEVTGLVSDLALKAPLADPALTGNPTAPTQATTDNSTKIATTGFVTSFYTSKDAASDGQNYVRRNGAWTLLPADPTWTTLAGKPATFPPTLPIAQSGVTNLVTDLGAKAPLASPALTGVPTAPTASVGTNTTQIATTAYVKTNLGNYVAAAGDTMTGSLIIDHASSDHLLRLETGSATGNPYISFYQNGVRAGFIQFADAAGFRIYPDSNADYFQVGNAASNVNNLTYVYGGIAYPILHHANAWYTGTANANLTYPVGSCLLVYCSAAPPARNAAVSVYLFTDTASFANSGTAGNLLVGTWRSRGQMGSDVMLAQRTA